MGKKSKKGKKSSGKKKGKKGKKDKEQQMTWREALLAYKINIKEKAMEDLKYEVKGLEDNKQRLETKMQKLQSEQKKCVLELLQEAKKFEEALAEMEDTSKEEVISVMMDKWQAQRDQDKEVADIKEKIAHLEKDIVLEERELQKWLEYKDHGLQEQQKQETLLQQELDDNTSTFTEMKNHLEKNMEKSKSEIVRDSEQSLGQQKYMASEKAMAKMDKYSRQEIIDNDWLKTETLIHEKEASGILEIVEQLERDNLEIMSELFECTVDDLKISRNFYLTQFADSENPEKGLLEMDLSKLDLGDEPGGQLAITAAAAATDEELPPKSDRLLAIENKVNSVAVRTTDKRDEENVDEETYDGIHDTTSEDEDPFNIFYYLGEDDFSSYMQLGPLELKLLSIRGRQVKVHPQVTLSAEEATAKTFCPDDWPVTPQALQSAIQF